MGGLNTGSLSFTSSTSTRTKAWALSPPCWEMRSHYKQITGGGHDFRKKSSVKASLRRCHLNHRLTYMRERDFSHREEKHNRNRKERVHRPWGRSAVFSPGLFSEQRGGDRAWRTLWAPEEPWLWPTGGFWTEKLLDLTWIFTGTLAAVLRTDWRPARKEGGKPLGRLFRIKSEGNGSSEGSNPKYLGPDLFQNSEFFKF